MTAVSEACADLAAVRELHRPLWYDPLTQSGQVWLVCHGCDEGGHAEGPPSWPCRTADLVYTHAEITAREPQVPECPENHRTVGTGPPARARAVFLRPRDGLLVAARWKCDHVQPVPVAAPDDWVYS